MRLIVLAAALASWRSPAPDPAPDPASARAQPGAPEDLLGELVVEAKRGRGLVLPKLAVQLADDHALSREVHGIVRRDMALSGEFRVVEDPRAQAIDELLEPAPFVAAHVEAVVRVVARERDGGQTELALRLFLPAVGEQAVFAVRRTVAAEELRLETHRLVDEALGALTGIDGPFASRLILIRTEDGGRRAYTIDADGEGLTPLGSADELVVTATLDPQARPWWAASTAGGRYRLRRGDPAGATTRWIDTDPRGSIYGIAFARDGTRTALTIAEAGGVGLYAGGADFRELARVGSSQLAMHPTFAPDGRLVYASASDGPPRIIVGRRAVSPAGLAATAPAVCAHPDGPRLVYEVGVGKRSDLVAADLDGRSQQRLTKGQGRNSYPACSPDGRLLAFFSTRTGGEGPGLYLMRLDGRRPHRISTVVGDSLHWARIAPRPATSSASPPPAAPNESSPAPSSPSPSSPPPPTSTPPSPPTAAPPTTAP